MGRRFLPWVMALATGIASAHPAGLTSPAFVNGKTIPSHYTCLGAAVSPPLRFGHLPAGTQGLALIAWAGKPPQAQWVLYDLPPEAPGLGENVPLGVEPGLFFQGRNGLDRLGYSPPCAGLRYTFVLYALDVPGMGLTPGASYREVLQKMQGHVLQKFELVGYSGEGPPTVY